MYSIVEVHVLSLYVRHLVKAPLVESEKGPKKCLGFEQIILPSH